ncbi:hypothetical protein [Cotesia plutellae polydnavirus]|nr:hypothetical protein [Cotesia plutellae polydnavirus]ABK63367.1 hypothetical protein [Cotesia plutellae polydnavirus]
MIWFGSSLAQLKPKSFRIHELFSRAHNLVTGFSEGGSTAVDALPQGYTVHQQYSFQNGTGNQQASVVNGSVVQQSFQQVWSTMPLLQLPFGFYNPSDDNSYKD